MQVHNESSSVKSLPCQLVADRSATGAQNDLLSQRQLVDDLNLSGAKRGLPFDFKNGAYGHASPFLDHLIRVQKGVIKPLRQQLSDRGLACSHQSDQKNLIAVCHKRRQ